MRFLPEWGLLLTSYTSWDRGTSGQCHFRQWTQMAFIKFNIGPQVYIMFRSLFYHFLQTGFNICFYCICKLIWGPLRFFQLSEVPCWYNLNQVGWGCIRCKNWCKGCTKVRHSNHQKKGSILPKWKHFNTFMRHLICILQHHIMWCLFLHTKTWGNKSSPKTNELWTFSSWGKPPPIRRSDDLPESRVNKSPVAIVNCHGLGP